MDVGLVPMRPRGHPSRLYSDLALIQQYRSGVNGGTGSAASAADAAVTSSSVELSSGSVSPHGGSECDVSSDRRSAAGAADISTDDIQTTELAATSQDEDDQSVSWSSVEMVAVNQAILSLTGQQPIDVSMPAGFLRTVKTEFHDASYHDSQLDTPPPPPTVDST